MNRKIFALSLVPVFMAISLAGCLAQGDCPDLLAYHTISVVDGGGTPVEGLDIEVIHVRSGNRLDVTDPITETPGEYVVVSSHHVMHDGPVRNGDQIEVKGSLGQVLFTETYVVRSDGCHPTGLEGQTHVQVDM